MITKAGSMGTDVKSAFTSKDIMTSSGCNWIPLRSSRKSWLF